LVLLGPSGCGKTTILRIIAGLEKLTTGAVYIGEYLVASSDKHTPPKDRDIAMVFQSYALYPHMNVYQNMAFPLKIRKSPKEEMDSIVNNAAELLGIRELLLKKPGELSGGQRQRMALGRAIVRQPRVFLMDEPLSNLDAKLRVRMRVELKKLQKELGTTTIYVTHDQTEAMTMGDRIVVLSEGRIQQIGEPAMIYTRPANTFVAGFIGSPPMNLIEVSVIYEDGMLDATEFKLEGIARLAKEYVGKDVIIGIRPDDIYLDASGIINCFKHKNPRQNSFPVLTQKFRR
jgi:multiple sugar transport system ATP-binding protein